MFLTTLFTGGATCPSSTSRSKSGDGSFFKPEESVEISCSFLSVFGGSSVANLVLADSVVVLAVVEGLVDDEIAVVAVVLRTVVVFFGNIFVVTGVVVTTTDAVVDVVLAVDVTSDDSPAVVLAAAGVVVADVSSSDDEPDFVLLLRTISMYFLTDPFRLMTVSVTSSDNWSVCWSFVERLSELGPFLDKLSMF